MGHTGGNSVSAAYSSDAMDTQLVLPGQMQILSEAALASLPTDKSREGLEKGSELGGDGMTMRLPMPRISDEEFHEKLRNLELECQQLRDSKSQLEQENALLKAQMGRSLESSETTESRLKGSISVAETQHQVLRRRMRAMLEDQRRLVDELQQEIAQVPLHVKKFMKFPGFSKPGGLALLKNDRRP